MEKFSSDESVLYNLKALSVSFTQCKISFVIYGSALCLMRTFFIGAISSIADIKIDLKFS